ncbi:MAG: hypothetical protein V3V84_00745 [Candidatus Bathyarchaeia archaeon]
MFIQVPKEHDDLDSEGNPPIDVITGIQETQKHDMKFGTTAQLYATAYDHINPGKSLTTQEYENSQYKRPGVSFPNGVSEARAKRSADRHDANLNYQNTMSGLSNGFLRASSKFIGGTAAFVLDPLNLGAMALAGASAGALSAPLVGIAAEYGALASRGAQFVKGAYEGAAFVAPQTAVDFTAGKIYGEHPSVLTAVSSLAINAALGGVLMGAFGGRIIDNTNQFHALKTSVDQLEAGAKVDVSEIIQDGAYQQDVINKLRKTQIRTSDLESQNVSRRTSAIEDLENIKKELDPIEGHDDVKAEVDRQIDLLKKDIPDEELDLSQPELPDSLKREPISSAKLIDGDYRIEELQGKMTENTLKARNAWEQMTDNLASLGMTSADKEPLTVSDLNAAASRTKSAENVNTFDPQESLQFDRETNKAREATQTGAFSDDQPGLKELVDTQELKQDIKGFSEELPEDIKEHFDNIDNIEKSHNTISDALNALARCLIGE